MKTAKKNQKYETYQHPPTPYVPTLSLDNYVATGLSSEQRDAIAKLAVDHRVRERCYQHLVMTQEVTDRPLSHGGPQLTRDNPNRVRNLLMYVMK
jgi:hypothetical protein